MIFPELLLNFARPDLYSLDVPGLSMYISICIQ